MFIYHGEGKHGLILSLPLVVRSFTSPANYPVPTATNKEEKSCPKCPRHYPSTCASQWSHEQADLRPNCHQGIFTAPKSGDTLDKVELQSCLLKSGIFPGRLWRKARKDCWLHIGGEEPCTARSTRLHEEQVHKKSPEMTPYRFHRLAAPGDQDSGCHFSLGPAAVCVQRASFPCFAPVPVEESTAFLTPSFSADSVWLT